MINWKNQAKVIQSQKYTHKETKKENNDKKKNNNIKNVSTWQSMKSIIKIISIFLKHDIIDVCLLINSFRRNVLRIIFYSYFDFSN